MTFHYFFFHFKVSYKLSWKSQSNTALGTHLVCKIAKTSKHDNDDMNRGLPPFCCLSSVEFLPPYSSPTSPCWQTEGCHGRGTQCFHWGHLRYKKKITMACGKKQIWFNTTLTFSAVNALIIIIKPKRYAIFTNIFYFINPNTHTHTHKITQLFTLFWTQNSHQNKIRQVCHVCEIILLNVNR